MAGLFQKANEAVLLSVGSRLDWTTLDFTPSGTPAPSDGTDGAPTNGSPVVLVAVRAEGSCSIQLHGYIAGAWYLVAGAAADVDARGFVERYNVAGFDRVAVQVSAASGSGAVSFGRAVL